MAGSLDNNIRLAVAVSHWMLRCGSVFPVEDRPHWQNRAHSRTSSGAIPAFLLSLTQRRLVLPVARRKRDRTPPRATAHIGAFHRAAPASRFQRARPRPGPIVEGWHDLDVRMSTSDRSRSAHDRATSRLTPPTRRPFHAAPAVPHQEARGRHVPRSQELPARQIGDRRIHRHDSFRGNASPRRGVASSRPAAVCT